MSTVLKRGSSGNDVRTLQDNLKKLGFHIESDGSFGEQTHNSVITLQTVFGYDVDGQVGSATHKLVEQQVGYGWNLELARKAWNKPQNS